MKYKTLFRLLLKLLGVWLTANGVVSLVVTALIIVSQTSRGFDFIVQAGGPGLASGLVQVGLGLYLFFGGRWIADKAIPSNRPYCHECGYDLTLAESNRCPECGTEFRLAC